MINPNEAPAGFEAVEYIECAKCVFADAPVNDCFDYKCFSHKRKDKERVMFRALKKPVEIQFPYGSCGEYM